MTSLMSMLDSLQGGEDTQDSPDTGPRIDVPRAQSMIDRYRPQVDGNYNANPMIQDRLRSRDEAQEMIEATMGHADMAAGLERTVLGARIMRPGQEDQPINERAFSKGGGGDGNTAFGKSRKVTRRDLYKLKSNAAKAVATMRKMGFNGTVHGFGQRSNKTDHDDGNAADFMVGKNRKLGNKIARHFIANRKQHGVKYVIWRQRIASSSTGWKWKPMEDRGSGTANHMDHPHVSFY